VRSSNFLQCQRAYCILLSARPKKLATIRSVSTRNACQQQDDVSGPLLCFCWSSPRNA